MCDPVVGDLIVTADSRISAPVAGSGPADRSKDRSRGRGAPPTNPGSSNMGPLRRTSALDDTTEAGDAASRQARRSPPAAKSHAAPKPDRDHAECRRERSRRLALETRNCRLGRTAAAPGRRPLAAASSAIASVSASLAAPPPAREDRHVSARQVPAFVPARVFAADTRGAALRGRDISPCSTLRTRRRSDRGSYRGGRSRGRPTAPSAPRLLSA